MTFQSPWGQTEPLPIAGCSPFPALTGEIAALLGLRGQTPGRTENRMARTSRRQVVGYWVFVGLTGVVIVLAIILHWWTYVFARVLLLGVMIVLGYQIKASKRPRSSN